MGLAWEMLTQVRNDYALVANIRGVIRWWSQ